MSVFAEISGAESLKISGQGRKHVLQADSGVTFGQPWVIISCVIMSCVIIYAGKYTRFFKIPSTRMLPISMGGKCNENCCIIYFGGAKICDVTNLGGKIALLCSLVCGRSISEIDEFAGLLLCFYASYVNEKPPFNSTFQDLSLKEVNFG